MCTAPFPSDDHIHVATVSHESSPIGVWFDPRPGMRAIMVEVEAFGDTIYLPAEVARAVGEAIMLATVPAMAWCVPARCADAA